MLRRRLIPKTIADITAVSFLVIMFPIVYWFEVFLIMPLHFGERNILYMFNFIISTYLLINVVGNYVAIYVTDTSIEGKFLSSELKPKWKICEVCECITPPRSWHCDVCNICILKRDHHCNFTSCCIGHYNQRYFLMFLLYLTISTTYATYFNVFYLWKYTTFSFTGVIRLCLPLAALLFSAGDTISLQLYRLLCIISIVGMVAAGTVLYYHIVNVCKGVVMYEKNKNIKDYDTGNIKQNIRVVFGKRWYLTWILPFINSELPNDGIHWNEIKLLSAKSK